MECSGFSTFESVRGQSLGRSILATVSTECQYWLQYLQNADTFSVGDSEAKVMISNNKRRWRAEGGGLAEGKGKKVILKPRAPEDAASTCLSKK